MIFTHQLVSKKPISQSVLDGWKRHPVSTERGPSGGKLDVRDDHPAKGSSKMRPKAKKGLSCGMTSLTFTDRKKSKLSLKTVFHLTAVQNTGTNGT